MPKKLTIIVVSILIIFTSVLSVYMVRSSKMFSMKVGIVDTCLNVESISNYDIEDSYNLMTNIINNHGDMVVDTFRSRNKNSKLYYACAMDENGLGSINDIVDSLKWLEQQNVDIICLSLTTLTNDDLLRQTIQQLIEKGVVIVAACLNYSDATTFPASYPGVVSVSNCENNKATISITDKTTKDMLLSYKWNDCSTSSLTAFITGEISSTLHKDFNIRKIVDRYNKNERTV